MNPKNLNKLTSNKYFIITVFLISILMSVGGIYFKDFFIQSTKLGLLGIFIINFFSSATFFVSGPAFLSVIAGGAIYAPLLVAFIASLGASMGDIIGFSFGYSSRHLVLKKLEKHSFFVSVENLFKKYGTITLFFLAFIPNPFFDAIGLIAGVFKYNLIRFFLIILLARFLRYIILALMGAKFY